VLSKREKYTAKLAWIFSVFYPLNADLYFNPNKVKNGWPKDWNRELVTLVRKIGNHQFCKEIPL
jgi:hypothetical protein